MKALIFSRFGSPEVLKYKDVPDPFLNPEDILVEMKSIGLNYADIYRRKGDYHLKGNPPYIAGYEGAGIVIDTNHHNDIKIGGRIGFADVPYANAELVAVPVTHSIPLPDNISFETASAIMLQGLTAQYLTSDSHLIKKNELVLIHAASGGVGQLLTQICKFNGAIVIGLTTSEEKKQIILNTGADAVFNLQDDWKKEVQSYSGGKGVDVVYDSVGSTLLNSIDVTRTGGQVVFFGMSGGDPQFINPRALMDSSKTITGGDLWNFLTSKEERIKRASKLFSWVTNGLVKLNTPVTFTLADGKSAHIFLESGKSAGKILLIPGR